MQKLSIWTNQSIYIVVALIGIHMLMVCLQQRSVDLGAEEGRGEGRGRHGGTEERRQKP
jgi:hypothetical protein